MFLAFFQATCLFLAKKPYEIRDYPHLHYRQAASTIANTWLPDQRTVHNIPIPACAAIGWSSLHLPSPESLFRFLISRNICLRRSTSRLFVGGACLCLIAITSCLVILLFPSLSLSSYGATILRVIHPREEIRLRRGRRDPRFQDEWPSPVHDSSRYNDDCIHHRLVASGRRFVVSRANAGEPATRHPRVWSGADINHARSCSSRLKFLRLDIGAVSSGRG